ncbi:MAG: hypothetical protein ACK4MJ_12235, partial [Hylemonella sp.]
VEVKAALELAAALAMFGLPQALFYFVRSGRLDMRAARRWGSAAAVAGIVLGAGVSGWHLSSPGAVGLALCALAVGAGVLCGIWRALLLLMPGTTSFNVATALPQWLMLACVLVACATGLLLPAGGWAGAWLVAWLAAWALAARTLAGWRPQPVAQVATLADVAGYGAANWLTASMASATIVLVQQAASQVGGTAGVGVLAMGMTIVQGLLTPLHYALPLLLKQRMAQGDRAPWPWRGMVGVAAAMLLLAAGAALAAPALRATWSAAGYGALPALLPWLLAGGAAEAASRLASAAVQARGQP